MVSHNIADTTKLAHRLAKRLHGGDVVGLVGPLGAGKTTFVQGMAKALGIKTHITSPTFILLQSYHMPQSPLLRRGDRRSGWVPINTLTHVDCYRLRDPQELLDIGIREHLNAPHTLTVIEWADRVRTLLPRHAYWIKFAHDARASRIITLDKRLTSSYA